MAHFGAGGEEPPCTLFGGQHCLVATIVWLMAETAHEQPAIHVGQHSRLDEGEFGSAVVRAALITKPLGVVERLRSFSAVSRASRGVSGAVR